MASPSLPPDLLREVTRLRARVDQLERFAQAPVREWRDSSNVLRARAGRQDDGSYGFRSFAATGTEEFPVCHLGGIHHPDGKAASTLNAAWNGLSGWGVFGPFPPRQGRSRYVRIVAFALYIGQAGTTDANLRLRLSSSYNAVATLTTTPSTITGVAAVTFDSGYIDREATLGATDYFAALVEYLGNYTGAVPTWTIYDVAVMGAYV